MKAIEVETILPSDGRLPASLSEAFGRKVRVILLYDEEMQQPDNSHVNGSASKLMDLAGKIQAFRDIEDPVAWQRQLRSEWD